jgi:hypothetical protein
MDKLTKLQKHADKLFIKHNIQLKNKDRFKILKQTSLYLDAVIFNIVSIFCLICILNNGSKITDKTIKAGRQYVENKCSFNYSMVGGDGRLGSATFLGKNETMYSINNPTEDILGVDYAGGIARPQIGGGISTNIDELHNILNKYVKDILVYHSISASNTIKKEILKIITFHITCFINNLKHHQGIITLSALKKIVKSNHILHPFK